MTVSQKTSKIIWLTVKLEQYSSGRRGAPAKGVGRETGARVRISLAPPFKDKKTMNFVFFYFLKKVSILNANLLCILLINVIIFLLKVSL